MLAKRIQPMVFQARRLYVEVMFQVMGRALQAVSEVDEQVQNEARALPDGFLFEMMVMPDGSKAISGSNDKSVRVWDLRKNTCTAVMEGHPCTVWSVAMSADGSRAVSGGTAAIVRMHACWWGVESIICNMFKKYPLAGNRHWNMHGGCMRVPMPIAG